MVVYGTIPLALTRDCVDGNKSYNIVNTMSIVLTCQ